MPTSLDKALAAIAISTFEGLGFLLATEDEGEGRKEPFEGLTARIDFQGASTGCLELRLSADVLEELAGNMLVQCDPPRDLQLDALGEVANVLIGNFMPVLGAGIQMGTPRVEDQTTPPPVGELMAHTRLAVESGKAEVVVYMEAAR